MENKRLKMRDFKKIIICLLVICFAVICIQPAETHAGDAGDDGLTLREHSMFAGEETAQNARGSGDSLTHNEMFDGYIIENGIDVSKHNGKIDWAAVKESGVDFVMIRMAFRGYATSGKIVTDERAFENLEGALENGIDVGVYFFSQAITTKEAVEEAEYIMGLIGEYDIDPYVVMDFEYVATGVGRLYNAQLTDRQRTDICLKFCETVEDEGYTAMVYANKSMLTNDLYADEINAEYDIWLAEWSTKAAYDNDYRYWQYTDAGRVNGISGVVDKDVRYIDPAFTVENLKGSNDPVTGKPVITWDKVDGADTYRIYRATSSNGTYSPYYTTDKRRFTNTSAEAGKTYYYKVAAVRDGEEVSMSVSVSRTCDLPKPTGVKSTTVADSGKPKVTWNKVEGADRYDIYRATGSNGTYQYMYTTTATSYTNTSAVAGKTYYYKVVAVTDASEYADSAKSSYSYITCDLAKPVNVKVSNVTSSGKPKITWTAVSGAKKYYVYRATSKNGTYSYLGSTTNTSYTNTGAAAGKTYYYKVKAVISENSAANSVQSNSCYITCDLAKPSGVKVALSSGNPKVSWSAVSGADKYYVYRATSANGTYSYMGYTTKTSYTNASAKAGTKYYYKVKAIKSSNSAGNSALSGYVSITSK